MAKEKVKEGKGRKREGGGKKRAKEEKGPCDSDLLEVLYCKNNSVPAET